VDGITNGIAGSKAAWKALSHQPLFSTGLIGKINPGNTSGHQT
jgi:hypothetical protein